MSLPLVLWLQGGPGSSSMTGAFFEVGPVTLDNDAKMRRKADLETWASIVPVLFVDSPIGTGWSFAVNESGYARNESAVASNLAAFLEGFRTLHPEVPFSLVLAGESYAGHYIPALGAHLIDHGSAFRLQAVMIGDGLTDPPTQVLTKPQEAFAFGLLDEKQLQKAEQLAHQAHDFAQVGAYISAGRLRNEMEDFVRDASQVNLYDVRTTEQYDARFELINKFFKDNATKDLLHVPHHLNFGTDA